MTQIEYTIVKSTDNAALLELYRGPGWWQQDANPKYLNTIARIVAQSFCFVIAQREDEIIGMGRALSDGISDAYIQDVTVKESERGQGIGKEIIRTLVKYLKEHKIQWIGLISEPGYEGFYSSLGFNVMQDYTPFLLGD